MTTTSASDLYYDPYSVEIAADPYPTFRRLREEAPLYYNEAHDFFAVSRFEDVERGLVDRDTYISGRGGILELIKADIEMPPGVVIFEDPPTHTLHRKKLFAIQPSTEGPNASTITNDNYSKSYTAQNESYYRHD